MTERRDIAWWSPEIGSSELPLVREVLESGYVNEGEVTARFERAIASLVGAAHGVATTSGTTAIFLALAAAGVGHGDEVLVPDVTFIATANAVTLAGATPVLVDCHPRTLLVDPAALERAITARTRAVVPVHISGRGADMAAIQAIAARRALVVIEDAAEALGSMHEGRWLGTWGKAGCFSFSPNKTITSGQGGMIVTDDGALAQRLRELKDQGRPARGTGGDDLHPTLGFNFKLTNLQSAVALGQLGSFDARRTRQRRIQELYASGLAGVEGIVVLPFDLAGGACPQWTDALCERRDALAEHLLAHGAHTRKFWFPLHTQAPDQAPDGAFPNATAATRRALWLPSAFTLTDDDVRTVVSHVRAFYGAR